MVCRWTANLECKNTVVVQEMLLFDWTRPGVFFTNFVGRLRLTCFFWKFKKKKKKNFSD